LENQHNTKIWSLIKIKIGDTDWPFFVLSNSWKNEDKYVLLLSCSLIPLLDKNEEAALTFLGWFDDEQIALNHSQNTSFLALSYPLRKIEELKEKIGSMDYLK
jgi:hypothetical protein